MVYSSLTDLSIAKVYTKLSCILVVEMNTFYLPITLSSNSFLLLILLKKFPISLNIDYIYQAHKLNISLLVTALLECLWLMTILLEYLVLHDT